MAQPRIASLGFRSWLLLLVAFAALPLILFSIITLLVVIESQREVETAALVRRAASIAATIDRHLTARAAMLSALAKADAARNDDREALYAHAVRMNPVSLGLLSIGLIDASGHILFNTMRPFGQVLPDSRAPDAARRVIEKGRSLVSGPFPGVISHEQVVALGVPVEVGGEPRYSLRAVASVSELDGLLTQQHLPDAWSVSIVSGQRLVAAQGPDALFGSRAGKALESGQPSPMREADMDEPVEMARANVGDWGWTVVVSVPERAFVKPLRRLLVRFGIGGILCFLAGLAASLWLSRRLDRDVRGLTSTSLDADVVAPPHDEGIIIREMGQVRACLLAAKDREEQAMTDELTSLPGRARFWELAEILEAQTRQGPDLGLAVMFLDLDGFKLINDTYGHDRGDWVLTRVAAVLRHCVREKDVVGRLGGDEFVVCLTAPNEQLRPAAVSLAMRLVASIGEIGYGLGCSIGVALCDGCSASLKRALDLADSAMYEAKRLGKNQFVVREDQTRDET